MQQLYKVKNIFYDALQTGRQSEYTLQGIPSLTRVCEFTSAQNEHSILGPGNTRRLRVAKFLSSRVLPVLSPSLSFLSLFAVSSVSSMLLPVLSCSSLGQSSIKKFGKLAKLFLLQILCELNVCIWHLAVILCKCVNWPLAMNMERNSNKSNYNVGVAFNWGTPTRTQNGRQSV